MARIVERCDDMYRVWYTVSDTYCHEPMTREDMVEELLTWGWTPENVEKRLDTAEVVEQWAQEVDYDDPAQDPWPG